MDYKEKSITTDLLVQNQALRNAANGFKARCEELEAKNRILEEARENANEACAKWEHRAQKAEEDRDRLREAMRPNCLMCDSMHENGNCTEVGGFCTAVPAAHCPLIPRLMYRVKKLSEDMIQERLRAEADCAKWEGLYYTELEKRRYFVTEYCPHCDTESTLMWSVEEHGYEIYCPVCGKKIMLCSMCEHTNDCDWTEESGCKMKKEEYHE